jgi:hypothetical protein
MRYSIVLFAGCLLTITTAGCLAKEDPVKTAECAPQTNIDECQACCGGGSYSFVKVYGKSKCACLASSRTPRTASN